MSFLHCPAPSRKPPALLTRSLAAQIFRAFATKLNRNNRLCVLVLFVDNTQRTA
uniref:Uncharacterized protein n=1 Tax=Anguilla anguilla TaxID=7936 RepID=A0A0E9UNQ9_ANGAN